ncbi:tail fiber protein [Rhizobium phage RHph_N3_8]|uniref:tail fiber protein n=1 Tax=Rhizobium phage RHph_N3_8 TaxID=2509748 RepID=UPI001AF2923C|nr:tail fiber protein [Rhizobium phage RHph_N3_8]QIG76016.1 tail fiber protein [Rhizobium phage RHph_N3_8]
MTITPVTVTPFGGSIGPLNRVTPFTHRDNATFLSILRGIVEYLQGSLQDDINSELERIINEFRDIQEGDQGRYDEFIAEVNTLVAAINNRVGPESMHRVSLTGDYTLTIDPTWPNAHPIRFQFTQDTTGGRIVSFGAGIVGSALVDPTPSAMTELELIPDGAGNWMLRTLNKARVIDVAKDFGARPGGVFDNTVKFNAAMTEARASKCEVFIPAGVWFVSGTVDFSGVVVRGVIAGYDNHNGTIIRGGGSNLLFDQGSTSLDYNRMGLHGIRFENCATGFRISYSVYSHFSDVDVIDTTADAIIVGDVTIIGPIWNMFDRVKGVSTNGYGLRLAGMNWCNSNVFDTCFFDGTTGAINILSASGFGSLDNVFRATEIRSSVGPGIVFNGTNRSTTLEKCFIEPKGPAVVVNNSTVDLILDGNVYGSTRNNVVGYGPYFVEHKAATFNVRVIGGWITTNAVPEQADLRFVGSALPASMTLELLAEPNTVGIQSSGYKIFDETVISAAPRTQRGDFRIRKFSAPQISVAYGDGSKEFVLKRNGTQGGTDFGVEFIDDGNKVWSTGTNGMFKVLGHLASAKVVPATTLGSISGRIPLYNADESIAGSIPVMTGTT